MEQFINAFLEKNRSLRTTFIIYEGTIGTVLLIALVLTFMKTAMLFILFLIALYVYDLIMNNLFLQEAMRNNKYYSQIVVTEPGRCCESMGKTIQYNTETYMKQYYYGYRFSKSTFLNAQLAGGLNAFYSNLIYRIETKRETSRY